MAKNNLLNNDNILLFPDEEFIPFACYIDKTTILTKNAELLMTFKIPSLISNQPNLDLFEIRQGIRTTLLRKYQNDNISFYFTTVRKKADIIPYGENNNYFSNEVSEIWNKQNNWNHQFVNEIYITVLISTDIKTNLLNPLFFLTSLTQTGINSLYSKKISQAHKVLKKFANNLISDLKDYDLRVLSIKEGEDGILYSEHMRFFSLLINLEKFNFPLTYDSISDIIRIKKLSYGYDIIETDLNGDKKFASVLSVKSFQDLTLSELDKILQLDLELVITDAISFIDNKYVESLYKEQKEMISLSEDIDLAYISGLDDLLTISDGKGNNYCIGQTTIMILNKNRIDLNKDLKKLYKSLHEIGLVAVKENVFLPTIFWSQLPGNFRFLRRFSISPKNKLATYLSLFNFPTGKLKFNYWGNAISILPTAINTPYFFNFHNRNIGNTMIVGLEDRGKTSILNFLLSQTAKINPKIFYIDPNRSSEVFINAMGGKYYKVSPKIPEDEQLKINPFMIKENKENENFLIEFIKNLVDFQDDGFIEMGQTKTQMKDQYKNIPNIVQNIFKIPLEERSFEKCVELFNNKDTELIYKKLGFWYKKEQTSFIFNHQTNTIFDNQITGISLKTIIENKNLTIPVSQYLFHTALNLLNDEPFILVIDDAWEIIDNKVISPIFFEFLLEFSKRNGIIIITTSGDYKLSESSIVESINDYFATEIFLENPKINIYQKKVFRLQEEESRILSLMKTEDRNFLLKCLNDVIIASINLKDFGYYNKIFSNDNISINVMKKAKENAKSEDPAIWIPLFLKIIEEYDKTVTMKKMKENELNQMKWEEARSDEITQNKILSGN